MSRVNFIQQVKLSDPLPTHLPLKINPRHITTFYRTLINQGYRTTVLQIVKPGQLFGLVKSVTYRDQEVEHHVRCTTKGVITTEIEIPRTPSVWLHVTSHSISAHEWVIPLLEDQTIPYQVDDDLRRLYARHGPTEFVRDYMEFFRWLFAAIFQTPLGYVWKWSRKLRGKSLPEPRPPPLLVAEATQTVARSS